MEVDNAYTIGKYWSRKEVNKKTSKQKILRKSSESYLKRAISSFISFYEIVIVWTYHSKKQSDPEYWK